MQVSEFWTALERRQRSAPAAPFVTWYGSGGARAELSTVTYATAVAKTAGLLVDALEAEPGDRVRVALPLHWQLPVWLGACDVAGLTVVWPQEATIPGSGPQEASAGAGHTDEPVAVTVVAGPGAGERSSAATGTTVVSPDTPFGMPVGPVPDPLVDHFRAALGQPDVFTGVMAAGSWQVGTTAWNGARIAASADAVADEAGLAPGGRLLIGPNTPALRAALASWALPLRHDATVVLVQAGDVARIAAAEETTAAV